MGRSMVTRVWFPDVLAQNKAIVCERAISIKTAPFSSTARRESVRKAREEGKTLVRRPCLGWW